MSKMIKRLGKIRMPREVMRGGMAGLMGGKQKFGR